MTYLKIFSVFYSLILINACSSIVKNNNQVKIKDSQNKSSYIFNIEEINFLSPVKLLSTYSESSSIWNSSTWKKVENANKSRMILVQCLKNPENVDISVFDQLQAKFGESFNFWLDKGICQYQKRAYPQSYFSFEFSRQYANEKQKKQIDQWIGGIYFKQGYWSKAIEMWTKSKLPNSYKWDNAMAKMFNGKMDMSAKYFSQLINNEQINDSVLLARAHILASNQKYTQAQATLLRVSKKGKKLRKSYYFLSVFLFKKQRNIAAAQKVIKKAPKEFRKDLEEFLKG